MKGYNGVLRSLRTANARPNSAKKRVTA
jgi:hypothetical protein